MRPDPLQHRRKSFKSVVSRLRSRAGCVKWTRWTDSPPNVGPTCYAETGNSFLVVQLSPQLAEL